MASHPFKNRLQAGSSRLQVSPWHAPAYLTEMFVQKSTVPALSHLCSTARGDLLVPRTKMKTLPGPLSGTIYRQHKDSCLKSGVQLFHGAAAIPQHSFVGYETSLTSLVVSMVFSRLDYGNATLAGITDRLMDRLRSMLNASVRLIYASRRTEHVTPLLRDLHWLRYPDRINYKLAVLVYRCLQGLAPSYPADEFTRV